MKLPKVLSFIALISCSALSHAHHDISRDIDIKKHRDLVGTISLVEWINPHVIFHLSVEDENGLSQTWLVQADPPSTLLRRGISLRRLENMRTIEMRVYPSVSSPCASECMGYGYELNTNSGATYKLRQDIADLVQTGP